MRNRRFPAWSAPLVGIIGGLWCFTKAAIVGRIPFEVQMALGAVIGGLACGLIFLLDPRPTADVPAEVPSEFIISHVRRPSGVVGRCLALLGGLLFWTPVVGFCLNMIGLAVNWKSDDWARKASLVGFIISGLVTLFMVTMFTIAFVALPRLPS